MIRLQCPVRHPGYCLLATLPDRQRLDPCSRSLQAAPIHTRPACMCLCRAVRLLSAGLSDGAENQPEPLRAAAEAACAALAAHLPAQEYAGLASRLLQHAESSSLASIDLGLCLAQSAIKRLDELSGAPSLTLLSHWLPAACSVQCHLISFLA